MIVLDSSFLIAYHNRADARHVEAAELMRRFADGEWGRGLLLEYVFVEVVTVLLARRGLDTALHVADLLLRAGEIDLVPCFDRFWDALETFRRQGDGTLSFADAAIVAVARREAAGHVATFDADFRALDGIVVVPG